MKEIGIFISPAANANSYNMLQPNPGWGELCKSCINQDPSSEAPYPCKVVRFDLDGLVEPNIERRTSLAEFCDGYEEKTEPISVPAQPTQKRPIGFIHLTQRSTTPSK